MWTAVLFCSLVGLVAAENGWKPSQQYKYNIEARTLTGQHQVANQFTGSIIRGKLQVNVDSENQLTLQVHASEYADINQKLHEGWDTHIPENQVKYRALPAKNLPFQIHLNNGLVQKMVVDRDIPTWELNFLKGIVSQFQIDNQEKNLKYFKLNSVPLEDRDSGMFLTMEESINGEYDTFYEVSMLPRYLLQSRPELAPLDHLKGAGEHYKIVKTRNFSNSDQHIVYHYGMSGQEGWSEGTNTMGNFLTRTSQSTIVYSGNHSVFTIQSAETIETVLVSPHIYNYQKGIVVSRISLSLKEVTSFNGSSPPISNPKALESLVYEYQHGNTQTSDKYEDLSSSSSSSTEGSSKSSSKSEEEEVVSNTIKGSKRKIRSSTMADIKQNVIERNSDSSSALRDSSIGSSESELEPEPHLNEAPNIEFLPNNMLSQHSDSEQVSRKIERVAKKIGKLLNDPNEIPNNHVLSWFSLLTRLIMSASTQQILQASEKLYPSQEGMKIEDPEKYQNHRTWQAYRDAVADAGNGPALVAISSWIKSGKVKGNEAAQLIAVIPRSARYPTAEYMNYFFELVKSKEVQTQKFLNDSAILSFTDLVRRSQVDSQSSQHRYPINLSRVESHNHRSAVEEQFIPYLQNQLENAIAQDDFINVQVYIRALTNTAHPKILSVFEPYLERKRPVTNFQRLLMVAYLDDFIKVHPKTARSVLYRIYQNQYEIPELRVAAVIQIMKTNPPGHLLQHMAEHTNYDQSKQVNAAVKSAIESAAKGDLDVNPELVNNARSAVDHLSTEDYGARYSKHFVYSYLVKEVENLQYRAYGSSIQGTDGIYPDALLYSQNYNIGGYFPERFTASYMTSGTEQLINLLLKRLQLNNDPSRDGVKANERNNTAYTYQYISDILNWQKNEPIEVEGNILGSVLGGERFFPFDSNTIEQLPEIFRGIDRNLQKGVNCQESKFYNHYSLEMGFPLASGVQFTYSISVPTYIHLGFTGNGYLHQTQQYTRNNNVPISAGINGKFRFVWSNLKSAKMGFVAHYSQQRYLNVLEKNTQLYLPIKGNLDVNWHNLRASLQFLDDNKDFQKIFQSNTNVFTTHQNLSDVSPYQEGNNVQLIHVGPKKTFQNTFGDQQTGYKFQIITESENDFHDTGRAFYAFLRHGPEVFSDILYGDIFNNYVVLSYDTKNSSPHETTISLTYNDKAPEASKMVTEIRRKKPKARKELWRENDLEDQASSESSTNAGSGVNSTLMSLFAASISFGESQDSGKYLVTLVHADSPVSNTSRYLIYYSGEPFHKSEDSKELQVTAEIIVHKPQLAIFNFDDAFNINASTLIEGEISFSEPDESTLTFEAKMLLSEKRKQYLRNHPSATVCEKLMNMENHINPTCLRFIENVHYLDTYNLSINYDDMPKVVKNIGQAFYAMARHYGSVYNVEEIIDVFNKEGQVNIGVQFTENLRKANIWVEAPSLQSYFENVPIEDWAQPLLVQHSSYSPLQLFANKIIYSKQKPICSLETNIISTFNNRSYPVKFGDCYHVLAMSVPFRRLRIQETSQKYDYDQRNFSILVKDVGVRKKMLQLLLANDVLTLEPTKSKGVVFSINNRKVQISKSKIIGWSNGKNELHAYALHSDNNVILDINSHGMQLIYDGKSVQLSLSSHYSNKVRGLCGVFDGERDSDFTTPGNCIMKNDVEFTASYAVNDDTCQGPAKESHIFARNVPCYSKKVISVDVISDSEAGRQNRSKRRRSMALNKVQASCYIILVKTIQEGQNTCFSIRPQVLCNFQCESASSIQKNIDFLCLPNSVATDHWLSMINSGISPDFTNKMPNLNMNVTLPKTCVPK